LLSGCAQVITSSCTHACGVVRPTPIYLMVCQLCHWHIVMNICHICAMAQKQQQQQDEHLTERIIFPASKEMVQEIADYRFEHRIESRSEAIRRLIAAGLKAEGKRGVKK